MGSIPIDLKYKNFNKFYNNYYFYTKYELLYSNGIQSYYELFRGNCLFLNYKNNNKNERQYKIIK